MTKKLKLPYPWRVEDMGDGKWAVVAADGKWVPGLDELDRAIALLIVQWARAEEISLRRGWYAMPNMIEDCRSPPVLDWTVDAECDGSDDPDNWHRSGFQNFLDELQAVSPSAALVAAEEFLLKPKEED